MTLIQTISKLAMSITQKMQQRLLSQSGKSASVEKVSSHYIRSLLLEDNKHISRVRKQRRNKTR
jgi:hypothetical protein